MVSTDEFDPTQAPSFNTADLEEAQKNEPFLGGLVMDRFEPSVDFNGKAIWQYHWAVRPVNRQVAGKTGAIHGFVDYKLGRSSNFLLLTDALTTIYGTTQDSHPRTFGKGDNEGTLVGWWIGESFTDFKKRQGGQINPKYVSTKEFPMPIRIATDEEVAIYNNMAPYIPPVSTASDSDVASAATLEYTDDVVEQLIGMYDGKMSAQVVREANIANGSIDKAIKDEIVSGRAYRHLMQIGALAQNPDKSFVRV